MIIELLHKMAAHPWIYDRIQVAAGQRKTFRRIASRIQALGKETVLEVGGGTGIWRKLWPPSCRYICLDVEMPKLLGFRSKAPDGLAVLCDATQMAIASESTDVVMCIAVVHHLTDTMLEHVFEEASRVLKDGGQLILVDPILNRERWMGRMLWKLDRGSYPRSAEELRSRFNERFLVVHWEKFTLYHEYVFGIGVRR
jgi:ubiquinone/menaquinone biosynthesis C-methylase UbiE